MTMKLKLKIAICIALSTFATNSIAQNTFLPINEFRLSLFTSGGILIDTSNLIPNSNPNNCVAGGRFLFLDGNLPNSEYIQAILLEARANNAPISIGINGCIGGPNNNNHPRVISINR